MGKKIFDILGGNLIGEIRKLVDEIVTTKEEKLALNNKLTELEHKYKIELEQELTKRHQADMQSDNRLSKNIRPLSLIMFFMLLVFMIIGDSTGLVQIDVVYIDLVKQIFLAMIMFYFGGRTWEKVSNIKK